MTENEAILRELRQLRAQVDGLITRATISRVDDSKKTQNLQLELGVDEVDDGIEHVQPYGVSFVPPVSSESVCIKAGGVPLALCMGKPGDRPTGAGAGEGGLYTTGEWRLFVQSDGTVNLGEKTAAEFVALAEKVLSELQRLWTALAAHTHTSAAPGSPTGTPLVPAATPPDPPGAIVIPTDIDVAAEKVKAT